MVENAVELQKHKKQKQRGNELYAEQEEWIERHLILARALFTMVGRSWLLLSLLFAAASTEPHVKACDGTMRPEEADQLAQKHLKAGRAHATGGRHQDAMKSFRAAIRCREGLGEAHFHLALELQRGGELKQAVDTMQRAAALSPAIAGDAFFQVGYWRSQSGDGEGALDGFSRAVKADPQNAQA